MCAKNFGLLQVLTGAGDAGCGEVFVQDYFGRCGGSGVLLKACERGWEQASGGESQKEGQGGEETGEAGIFEF